MLSLELNSALRIVDNIHYWRDYIYRKLYLAIKYRYMSPDNKVESIYSLSKKFPRIFSKDFKNNGGKWETVSSVDVNIIGTLLTSHLILEHYLDRLIEFTTPDYFDWESSGLRFSQKLKCVSKHKMMIDTGFVTGINIVNKLRNKIAHQIQPTLDNNLIKALKDVIIVFRQNILKSSDNKDLDLFSDIAIVEVFTLSACSFLAAYITATLAGRHNLSIPEIKENYLKAFE